MPVILVVIPVYNVAPWLLRYADSVLSQEDCDIRVVLVDDGSTDGSSEMCDEVAARDPRVSVVHTPNRGLSAARNLGIDMAMTEGAELLTFVDPDDWLEPGVLATMERELAESGADLAWCGRDFWREGQMCRSSAPRAGAVSGEGLWRAYLSGDLHVVAWGKLCRAELFEGIRFPEGRVYEDLATTHRVLARYGSAAGVPVVGYHYLERDGSISRTLTIRNLADLWRAHVERRSVRCAS